MIEPPTLNRDRPDPSSLSRRERERRQRRLAMLRAALEVFAEKGYAHATLAEIAERAEFGKGTLYNYFEGGKEEILFAVFDEVYEDLFGLVEGFAADAERRPVREAFRRFVREAFDFFLERESLFMILLKESHRFIFGENRERAAYFHAQEDRLVNVLVPPLEKAAAEGTVRPLPSRPVARIMIENTKGVLVARAMSDHQLADLTDGNECGTSILQHPDQVADMLATMLFDGLEVPKDA